MPVFGLGTGAPDDSAELISSALRRGYRLIDTGELYGNVRRGPALAAKSGSRTSLADVTYYRMRGVHKPPSTDDSQNTIGPWWPRSAWPRTLLGSRGASPLSQEEAIGATSVTSVTSVTFVTFVTFVTSVTLTGGDHRRCAASERRPPPRCFPLLQGGYLVHGLPPSSSGTRGPS